MFNKIKIITIFALDSVTYFKFKKKQTKMKLKKFQTGGQMPDEANSAPAQSPGATPEAGAPAEGGQGGGDPMQQLVQVIMQLGDAANQALQSNDPNALAQVCQGLVQLAGEISQQMGGGQAPVFKKGGKVVKKKMTFPFNKGQQPQVEEKKCGGKMKK